MNKLDYPREFHGIKWSFQVQVESYEVSDSFHSISILCNIDNYG